MTRPSLRVVRGDPTPEELAAIAALMSSPSGGSPTRGDGEPEPLRRGRWNDPARHHRQFWPAGPGGWRSTR